MDDLWAPRISELGTGQGQKQVSLRGKQALGQWLTINLARGIIPGVINPCANNQASINNSLVTAETRSDRPPVHPE